MIASHRCWALFHSLIQSRARFHCCLMLFRLFGPFIAGSLAKTEKTYEECDSLEPTTQPTEDSTWRLCSRRCGFHRHGHCLQFIDWTYCRCGSRNVSDPWRESANGMYCMLQVMYGRDQGKASFGNDVLILKKHIYILPETWFLKSVFFSLPQTSLTGGAKTVEAFVQLPCPKVIRPRTQNMEP